MTILTILGCGILLMVLAGLFLTPLLDGMFDWGVDVPENMEEDLEE